MAFKELGVDDSKSISVKLLIWCCTIIFIFQIPILVVTFPIIISVKYFVLLLSKIFRPDLDTILPAVSTALALDDITSKPQFSIVIYCNVNGVVDIDALKSKMITKVIGIQKEGGSGELKNIELKQYPYKWMGFVFWKWDDHFDISNHIKYYKDGITIESRILKENLTEIEHDMLLKPFLEKKSPWEIILIPSVDSKNNERSTTILFRFHHLIADGFSLFKLSSQIFDGFAKELIPQPPNFSHETLSEKLICYIKFLRIPYDLAETCVMSFDRNDWKIPKNKMSDNWNATLARKIHMDEIKEVKETCNSSVNAVILSGITAAIRKAMLKRNGKVPKHIHIGLPFPLKGHPDKLTNYAVAVIVKLPVGDKDPVIRLKKIECALQKLKKSNLPLAFHTLSVVGCSMCYWMIKPLINLNYVPLTSWGSSFPGPKFQFVIFGNKIFDFHFVLGPFIGKLGVNFTSITYNNYFQLRYMVNESILNEISDVHELSANFQKELNVLKFCNIANKNK